MNTNRKQTAIQEEFSHYGNSLRQILQSLLEKHQGFVLRAAKELGVSSKTFQRWCDEYRIEVLSRSERASRLVREPGWLKKQAMGKRIPEQYQELEKQILQHWSHRGSSLADILEKTLLHHRGVIKNAAKELAITEWFFRRLCEQHRVELKS